MNGCYISIDAPKKILKGAGIINTDFLPACIYKIKIILKNSTEEFKLCSFSATLGNGIHYMSNLHMTGIDSDISDKVNVTEPNPSVRNNNVILYGNNFILSPKSENVISFDACLCDRYTINSIENSGDKIPHLSKLYFSAHLICDDVVDSCNITVEACDYEVLIDCEDSRMSIGDTTKFYIQCKAGQYDMVRGVYLRSVLDQGLDFIADSSNMEPRNVYSFDKRTVLKWDVGSLQPSEVKRIGYKVILKDDSNLIKAGDVLKNKINSNGVNNSTYTQCPSGTKYEITVL